jgi:uncharacterized protein (TIGR02466 family)
MIEITPFTNHCYLHHYPSTPDLLDVVVQHHAKDTADVKISNRGGWQSPAMGAGDDRAFDNVIQDIAELLQPIYQDWGFDRKPTLSNYWFNINPQHSYNLQHTHPGSLFSLVLYLQVPENSGNLVLARPDNQQHFLITDRVTSKTMSTFPIDPYDDLLVAFPSNMPHYVEQNNSDQDRISVAFNFK